MGSGVVFSSVLKGSLARVEASDIDFGSEMRMGGRVEGEWRLEKRLKARLMRKLNSGFELWNSAISSWVFSMSLASSH